MKYSAQQQHQMNELKIKHAGEANIPRLEGKVRELGTSVPKDVMKVVKSLNHEVDFALHTFASFDAKFPGEITPESTCIKESVEVSYNAKGKCLPIVHIYSPKLAKAIQAKMDEEAKEKHLQRFKNFLTGKRGGMLEFTPQMEDFVMNVLPVTGLPYKILLDGSEARVRALREKNGAKLYASTEVAKKLNSEEYQPGCIGDNVFAVEHDLAGIPVLTLYVKSHDFRGEFAKKLMDKLQLPEDVAKKISDNLDHSCYYSVTPDSLTSDFESFIENVARFRRLHVGGIVHDFFTDTDVEAFFAPILKKVVIDADNELPCAVLVGNRLNIYVPGSMMEVDSSSSAEAAENS